MRNLKTYILASLLLTVLTGCNTNKLEQVKKGALDDCSEYTVEELVSYYIEDPEWIVEKSNDSYFYIVEGEAYYKNMLSDVIIQFELENDEVYLEDFEVNDNSEDEDDAISDMCKTAELMEEDEETLQVPIKLIYNEEAYVVESADNLASVTMKIYGSEKEIEKFKTQEDAYLTLDLTESSEIGTSHDMAISYTNDNYELLYRIEPSKVNIKLMEKISEVKTLSYELLNDDSFKVSSVELQNTSVIVKSSVEKLEQISNIKAIIDIEKYDINIPGTYNVEIDQLVAYDSNGNVLTNIEIVPKAISAILVIE